MSSCDTPEVEENWVGEMPEHYGFFDSNTSEEE